MSKRYAMVNDTLPYRHIGCDAVMRTLRDAARQRGYTEVASHPVGTLMDAKAHAALIEHADLIVVNGEGTLHDDVPACQNLAHFVALAHHHGRRVAVLNASYVNNSPITTELLSRADIVAFRDRRSAHNFGDARHGTVVGDLSMLSFERVARPALAQRIYFTDSVVRAANRRIVESALRLGGHYAPVKDYWSPLKNRTLRFAIGGCLQRGVRLRAALEAIASGLVHTRRARFSQCMARAALVITGRYHVVAFCLLNRIPFYFVSSNTSKIEWLLEDIGIEPPSREIARLEDWLGDSAAPARVIEQSQFTVAESNAIERYLERQADDAAHLMDRVFA
jgi:hypothetical protein